ncbi:MAG: hypothetical protein ACKVHP_00700, partial [Verrucomicrobiales bacterium]
SAPNDTNTNFSFVYGGGATTAAGFALDTTESQNGRGIAFSGAEDNAIQSAALFPFADYTQRKHQIAFWFRYSDLPNNTPKRSYTQGIFVQNRGGSGLAYYL